MDDNFRENKLRYEIIWLDHESKKLRREIKVLNAQFQNEMGHGWWYALRNRRKINAIDKEFSERIDEHTRLTKETLKKALELQKILNTQ